MREIFLNPAQMYQIKLGNLLKRKKKGDIQQKGIKTHRIINNKG